MQSLSGLLLLLSRRGDDRSWDALRSASRTKTVVAFYRGKCIMHFGYAAPGHAPGTASPGPICEDAIKSGTGNYLAKLALFPGAWADLHWRGHACSF